MAQNSTMHLPIQQYLARPLVILVAGTVLAACGSSRPDAVPQLHLACQTVECECRDEKIPLFEDRKTTEIVWRQNGDATCPIGFVLERVRVDFLGRRK
tara:strand:+ start:4576 stop:4869 length:294 start_codon:yes stop_codon:yes gene_type:complete